MSQRKVLRELNVVSSGNVMLYNVVEMMCAQPHSHSCAPQLLGCSIT